MDLTSAASLRNETISAKLDDSIVHLFSRVFCRENSTPLLEINSSNLEFFGIINFSLRKIGK